MSVNLFRGVQKMLSGFIERLKHTVNSSKAPTVLSTMKGAVDDNIRLKQQVLDWMEETVRKMDTHQDAVRAAKTSSAAVGILGTALMFTPFFAVGIACTVASVVTGVGASIGDIVRTRMTSTDIKEKLESLKSCEERLQRLSNQLEGKSKKLSETDDMTLDEARVAILIGDVPAIFRGDVLHLL